MSSGDDDIAGEQLAGPESTGSRRSRKRSKASGSRGLGSDGPAMCHLCERPIAATEKNKVLKGCSFHMNPCWAAIRAHRRILEETKAPHLLDELDTNMLTNPGAWRAEVAPMAAGPASRSAARASLKAKVKTLVTVSEKSRITDLTIMNKRHFKSHTMFWDRCGSESASEEFEKLSQTQRGRHNTPTERRVAIESHEKLRTSHGTQEKITEEVELDMGGRADEGRHRRRHASSSSRRAPTRSRSPALAPGALRANEATCRRQRRPPLDIDLNSGDMNSGDTDPDEEPEGGPAFTPTKSVKSYAASVGASSSKGGNRNLAASSSLRSPTSSSKPTGCMDMSPVEFMQAKEKLDEVCADMLATISSKTGVVGKLAAAAAKLPADKMARMEPNPTDVLAKVFAMRVNLEKVREDMEPMQKREYNSMDERVKGLRSDMKVLLDEVSATNDLCQFMLKKGVAASKSQDNHMRLCPRRSHSLEL